MLFITNPLPRRFETSLERFDQGKALWPTTTHMGWREIVPHPTRAARLLVGGGPIIIAAVHGMTGSSGSLGSGSGGQSLCEGFVSVSDPDFGSLRWGGQTPES